jgi:dihydrolipoamide dehydrogenase
VTVVEYLDTILGGMDGDVAKQFQRMLAKQGFEFKLGTKVTGVATRRKGATVTFEPVKGGAAETIEADVVLVAIGRRPYTDGLGLKEAGVELDERGRVKIDGHLPDQRRRHLCHRRRVAGPMLAHKAEDEGVAVAEIIAGQAGHVNYDGIPGVVYTSPEVATVGKTEEELKKPGIAYKVGQVPVHRQWPRACHAAHRRLRQGSGRCNDRPPARRSHRRQGCRRDDPRGGVLMEFGGSAEDLGPDLPCASDDVGSGQGSGARHLLQADPHVGSHVIGRIVAIRANQSETARSLSGPFAFSFSR